MFQICFGDVMIHRDGSMNRVCWGVGRHDLILHIKNVF